MCIMHVKERLGIEADIPPIWNQEKGSCQTPSFMISIMASRKRFVMSTS